MAFVRFLWDFVVGDDWVSAAGVVLLLAAVALAVHAGSVNAWWLLPPGVIVVLALTLRRATRPHPARTSRPRGRLAPPP